MTCDPESGVSQPQAHSSEHDRHVPKNYLEDKPIRNDQMEKERCQRYGRCEAKQNGSSR